MTATAVVVVASLAIVFLAETVEPCNHQFIKDMVVKACDLQEKRSSDVDWSVVFGQKSTDRPKPHRKFSPRLQDVTVKDEDNILSLVTVGVDDDVEAEPRDSLRYKDITELIKECCARKCTVEDFRGVCGKI